MTMLNLPSLSGLTTGDAEVFDRLAAAKRASAVGCDPVFIVQREAEAAGLEAVAARLRDPEARGVPVLRVGIGTELRRCYGVEPNRPAPDAPPWPVVVSVTLYITPHGYNVSRVQPAAPAASAGCAGQGVRHPASRDQVALT